jgi:hypothetical protein
MATVRTVLNRVLSATGGAAIAVGTGSPLTDSYQLMLLEFLNEFKEEIEEAHQWRSLVQDNLPVTINANSNYALIANTNERSRLVRVPDTDSGEFVALVFDVTVPAYPIPLIEMDLQELKYRVTMDSTSASTTQPSYFAIDHDPTTGQQQLWVYPQPTTQRSIVVTMVVPQATLMASDTDTNIWIPTTALTRGLIWYAREERGEEIGPSGMFTEQRWINLLDAEIARDRAMSGDPYQLVVT